MGEGQEGQADAGNAIRQEPPVPQEAAVERPDMRNGSNPTSGPTRKEDPLGQPLRAVLRASCVLPVSRAWTPIGGGFDARSLTR
mmetsp:Transcript_146775/g.256314  ORF Transcript_146775/g.256314 Transcript_146775/m.256314 type:complete len:84 (-) Transcript_146775:186-437(-)